MHVPDLRAKIRLLLRFGPVQRKKDLAQRLDVSVSTLNGWISGTAKTEPEWVPNSRWSALLHQFALAIPKEPPPAEIERLVLGASPGLERALRPDIHPLLEELIAGEGQLETSWLHRSPAARLAEPDEPEDSALPSVKLREPFMIEVRTKRAGHILVLHNAGRMWGTIGFADGSLSPKHSAGTVIVPGNKNFGFAYIREGTTVGPHRIVTMVSARPFPQIVFDVHRSKATLDWSGLNELASHFVKVSKTARELHILHFAVTEA